MTIPTSEIPQAEQETARAIAGSAVLGRLNGDMQDRMIRTFHVVQGFPEGRNAYRALFATDGVEGGRPRFPDLSVERQQRVLDMLGIVPNLWHGQSLRRLVDTVMGSTLPSSVKDECIDVATRPGTLSAEGESGQEQDYLVRIQAQRLTAIQQLLATPSFMDSEKSSEAKQLDVLTLLDATGPAGLTHLPELLLPSDERWAYSDVTTGTIPLYSEGWLDRRTTLDHLVRLAHGPLDSRVTMAPTIRGTYRFDVFDSADTSHHPAVHRAHVLEDLVCELARPDQYFNQDNRGTCATTTILHRLGVVRPAEYARIAADLALGGTSQLANGDNLHVPDDAFASDSSSRSTSERLTQAATMQRWAELVGPNVDYRNIRASSQTGATASGADEGGFTTGRQQVLWMDPAYRLLASAALNHQFWFPRDLVRRTFDLIPFLENHFRAHPHVPVLGALIWGTNQHEIDIRRMDLPEATTTGERRIYFWNPWGAHQLAVVGGFPIRIDTAIGTSGTVFTTDGPNRQTVDDSRSLQSMTVADLAHLIYHVALP